MANRLPRRLLTPPSPFDTVGCKVDLGASYIDKNELRGRASLAVIAAELGVHFDANGVALCPFHENDGGQHRPSFRLWEDDAGVERWSCFPCGASGDVYDLVRRVEGLTFPEALERVAALVERLPDVPGRRSQTVKSEWDEEVAARIVHSAYENAATNEGWLAVSVGLVPEHAEADYRMAVDRFLRLEWRWGIDDDGSLVIPHYDALGQLTGVKYRALDGHKWALPGSKFTALYGAWRARRSRYVLLCEGEGDAAYASLQSPPVDVLSLPKGAGTFRDEWTQLEADVYFLAFDADSGRDEGAVKGLEATQRWLKELGDRDVRVCRLPLGHDLKSARPVMETLLRDAVRPRPVPDQVLLVDGRFERQMADGSRVITHWCMEPRARLETTDDLTKPALEVDVHHAGHRWVDVIALEELGSATKLRAWAAKRSLDCLASDNDVQHLGARLLAEALPLPEIFQTSRVGSHHPPPRYRYAGKTVVAPNCSVGRLPWRYVGPTEVSEHVLLCENGPVNWDWLRAFLDLNEPSVTHPLLAWLVASARRNELIQFPLLFLGGSSGSGKTTTANLAIRLMSSTLMVSLASVTQFALIRALSSTTTVPVFIDEWSLQSRQDARETVQAVVPVIYDGGVTPRGRADLSVVEYRLSSPILIAGEDSFHLDREADRMVALRLRVAAQNHDILRYLSGQPIERFGRWYAEWLVRAGSEHGDGLPLAPGPGLTRPEYNRAVLEMGWATLLAYLDHVAQELPVPELPLEPDLSQLDERVQEERENEYEAFINEGVALRDADGCPLVWEDEAGQGTWVRFRVLTAPRNMASVDVELPGRSRAMKSYFADRYELVDARVTAPYATKQVRATLVKNFYIGGTE